MEFAFAKGEDVTLKLNSEILGGVKNIVCRSKNSYTDIGSFLTDLPVYRIGESNYTVVLTMDCSEDNPFEGNSRFDRLSLLAGDREVNYTDCTVESVETTVGARGSIERVVTISAEERNVV